MDVVEEYFSFEGFAEPPEPDAYGGEEESLARLYELETVLGRDLDWKEKAACRGADTSLFFPERGQPTKEAKDVCASCVVRSQCLDYALEIKTKFGIWGEKSEKQRRDIRSPKANVHDLDSKRQAKGSGPKAKLNKSA